MMSVAPVISTISTAVAGIFLIPLVARIGVGPGFPAIEFDPEVASAVIAAKRFSSATPAARFPDSETHREDNRAEYGELPDCHRTAILRFCDPSGGARHG